MSKPIVFPQILSHALTVSQDIKNAWEGINIVHRQTDRQTDRQTKINMFLPLKMVPTNSMVPVLTDFALESEQFILNKHKRM